MSDRTIHATAPNGTQIVRYDRAGKWYFESPYGGPRVQVSLADAVSAATKQGSYVYLGLAGGAAFDRRVKRAAAESVACREFRGPGEDA